MKNIYKSLFILGAISVSLLGCNNSSTPPSPSGPIYNGETPILSSDGKTLTYGLYPQKNVNDPTLLTALNSLTKIEPNGWYLYNGVYYAKDYANPWGNHYTFNNGDLIVANQAYWFKCEPISWNVLSVGSGRYFITSTYVLDTHYFFETTNTRMISGKTIYANNFQYSDLRNWLNGDFYSRAFSLENRFVLTTNIDNSASTTNYRTNPYACDNFEDKIFPLSVKEVHSNYPNDVQKATVTTDYARNRGVLTHMNRDSIFYQCGNYWTRSPYNENGNSLTYVYYAGSLELGTASYTYYGVRPALNIRVS